MSFKPLTEEEEKEMYRLTRFYRQEAMRCEQAKAYLAGCVMLGSALETFLILMVNCYPEEAVTTGQVPVNKNKPKELLDWDLGGLLRVAKAAQWLPAGLKLEEDWNSKKAQIGDFAEIVRMVRNLAHPARYVEDHFKGRVTLKYFKRQFETVENCVDWLSERNNKSLIEHMKAEGIV